MYITAFVGSARKKNTYNATGSFLHNLSLLGDIKYEIVCLNDYNLGTCKGCLACFNKGEEFCPFKDDRDKLIEKINNSDGVVFASPNYSFSVSAIMKIFLDRLGFVFHRPRFFGITSTSIVTQGIYGGNDIVKYFNFISGNLGFNAVKGTCITTLEPLAEKAKERIEKNLKKLGKRFYSRLMANKFPTPSAFKIFMFRLSRSSIKSMLDDEYKDYRYYKEKGWLESDYYYPVKLNPIMRLIGKLSDWIGVKISKPK